MGISKKTKEDCYHIFLLRHGRSLGNENGFLQGQQDVPLTDEGREQVRLLAERWSEDQIGFDLIITSPLSRASETAGIIAKKLDCPVEQDPLLMERNTGSLSGAKVSRRGDLAENLKFTSPYRFFGGDGEGDWQLYLRAGQVLFTLMQRDPGSYLLVSHGGMINQLTHAILGVPPGPRHKGIGFAMENTGFSRFDYFMNDHYWGVVTINNIDHLRKKQSGGNG
jgi:broad specificity phosphatase PhoE